MRASKAGYILLACFFERLETAIFPPPAFPKSKKMPASILLDFNKKTFFSSADSYERHYNESQSLLKLIDITLLNVFRENLKEFATGILKVLPMRQIQRNKQPSLRFRSSYNIRKASLHLPQISISQTPYSAQASLRLPPSV